LQQLRAQIYSEREAKKTEKLRWSEWFSIEDLDKIAIPSESGVYEIRWALKGVPQPISRANGTDCSGFLYIGKSQNLKNRLRRFRNGIRTAAKGHANRNIHSRALTYSYFDFTRKYRPEQLQGRYARLPKAKIDCAEGKLILSYVRTYLDKPPLNISVKRL
jgi:hypothetical protein